MAADATPPAPDPPSASRAPKPPRAVGLIGVALSLATIVAVVVWALGQPAPTLPGGTGDLLALLAALVFEGATFAARGERWLRLLRREPGRPTRFDAWAITAVGYMGNNVLPARGGDALRVWLVNREDGTPVRPAIGTMVAERVLDLAVLLTTFLLLAYVLLRGIDAPGPGRLLAIAGGLLVAGAIAVAVIRGLRDHPKVAAVLGFLAPIAAATRSLRGRHGAAMLGFTILIWALETVVFLLVSVATGLDLDPVEALYVIAVASVFILIPSGPGYAGTLDAAILFGVHAVGGTGSQAIAYLLLVRLVIVVPVTIAGFALLVGRYGGRATLRAVRGSGRGDPTAAPEVAPQPSSSRS